MHLDKSLEEMVYEGYLRFREWALDNKVQGSLLFGMLAASGVDDPEMTTLTKDPLIIGSIGAAVFHRLLSILQKSKDQGFDFVLHPVRKGKDLVERMIYSPAVLSAATTLAHYGATKEWSEGKWSEGEYGLLALDKASIFALSYVFLRLAPAEILKQVPGWTKDQVMDILHDNGWMEEKAIEHYEKRVQENATPRLVEKLKKLYEKHAPDKLEDLEDIIMPMGKTPIAAYIKKNMVARDYYLRHYIGYMMDELATVTYEDRAMTAIGLHNMELHDVALNLLKLADDKDMSKSKLTTKALAYDYIGEPDLAKEAFAIVARDLVLDDHEYRTVGENKNPIYLLEDASKLNRHFVLKGSKEKSALEDEMRNAEELSDLLKDHPKYAAPRPLGIFETQMQGENTNVYTMVREKGKTLLSRINEGDEYKEIFFDVADYLALLHAKMQNNKGELDMESKVRRRLEDTVKDENLIRDITENYTPVQKSLALAIKVQNQDAHPDNWYVTKKGKIVKIDTETGEMVPQQLDLANLLNFGYYVTDEEEDQVLARYMESYNKHKGEEVFDMKDPKAHALFRTQYYAAVIHRAIAYFGFSSSRPERQPYASKFVNRALKAIGKIKDVNPAHYAQFKENYQGLAKGIAHLGL